MSLINCTGCGGYHQRPGGSRCRNLHFTRNMDSGGQAQASNVGFDTGYATGVAFPDSKVAWATILSPGELAAMPLREDPEYLSLCEDVIANLTKKLNKANEREKVARAEDQISGLMAQLDIGGGSQRRRSSPLPASASKQDIPSSPAVRPTPSRGSNVPPTFVTSGVPDEPILSMNPLLGHGHFSRPIVDEHDSKEYLSKLRIENHLVPVKSYELVNYRELMLGMDGVHSHLINNGRSVIGYEAHCHFIRRKSVSFLYSNLACVLYDRYVTDRIVNGELLDYPSACADASLEFFSDSYRRENVQKTGPGVIQTFSAEF